MSENHTPTPPQTGEFSWNELITQDTAKSGEFYSQLFGWQIVPMPMAPAPGMPPYLLFKTDTTPMGAGGMMQAMHECPAHWVPYVVVENADASVAKALALGAQVLAPVMPIPGVGRIAVLKDPQGAVIGLHELAKQA